MAGKWAIGLMSGTSADGVDAALIRAEADAVHEFGPASSEPYDRAFGNRIKACYGGRAPEAEIDAVARELTQRHAAAVRRLLQMAGMAPSGIHVIGFHGQTILHAPHERRTWQIGDGALLASLTGIDVVDDFRSADVAAGGQGAPLVPVFHQALAAMLPPEVPRPIAVLNIGGVANVTWIGRDGSLLAFDTGPGNALIDDWTQRHEGRPVDLGGVLARGGRIDEDVLATLLSHPYFDLPAPKSLDRNAFHSEVADRLSPADGAATLTAFTAAAIARSLYLFPEMPQVWLVCGGGRHNPVLMEALEERLDAPVKGVDEMGWNGDALEAQAFAYLALRSLAGLPISFPTTTGVPVPMTGGRLHRHAIAAQETAGGSRP
ncbi:anhydro-N-acetylmuramic acid kinase [Dongia mobilis]|uniref:Anhydro-N-acetylmuramic acid kinase n=1 Tax=Dongia mobilis TaxID=578943 RepID=A0A4R6WUW9_9PROT|nr:anhydro-N-acetylmuramic acid kinase [Dongia mobilis]TDQ80879.1 anhydro-N-acetylmuramic acid kinase [Dongia mobilis]